LQYWLEQQASLRQEQEQRTPFLDGCDSLPYPVVRQEEEEEGVDMRTHYLPCRPETGYGYRESPPPQYQTAAAASSFGKGYGYNNPTTGVKSHRFNQPGGDAVVE